MIQQLPFPLSLSNTLIFPEVQVEKFSQLGMFGGFDVLFHKLVCLFLVPIPASARASAHARHDLVSRFSAGNYLDTN